jgi:hypothetical protein
VSSGGFAIFRSTDKISTKRESRFVLQNTATELEIVCLTEVSPLEKTSLFYTRLKFHPGAIIFSLLVAKAVIK